MLETHRIVDLMYTNLMMKIHKKLKIFWMNIMIHIALFTTLLGLGLNAKQGAVK